MKEVMIYHPLSENYICVYASVITPWDYEPVRAGKPRAEDTLSYIWCYSAREDKNYGDCSSQGLHHKQTGAVLGISGTGETSGNVIVFSNKQSCYDLTLIVQELSNHECHIIWLRAGLYLTYVQEEGKLIWEKYPGTEQSVFQIISNYP